MLPGRVNRYWGRGLSDSSGICEQILGFHCSPAGMRLSEIECLMFLKNMLEIPHPFHFREAFLDGKCTDKLRILIRSLRVFSCERKTNHQEHFLVIREARKISNRLKYFCCCSFPPVYVEILFGFALSKVYVD